MGGEGSMLHAIKSLKANRALLKQKRSKDFKSYIGDGKTKVQFKKVSEEELAKIKENIRLEARISRNKEILLVIVILLVMGVLLIWLTFPIFN
ncbi:MAG: hypothetical protein CML04_01330 [Pseudozobellia sp.]|nr:hypothetical protein [Pseudozobellia sp.]MBG48826.1 hypothetical protein [Pseudozobellia sp.]|tara:strand:- start:40 stop:318 length:279 start_codon:yes stop_codon:yes gene_type:complete